VSVKPVIPRQLANRDIEQAIEHLLNEAGEKVALGFVDALETAFARIGRAPGVGTTRYAHELDLPGLRTWRLKRYPYLVFFFERSDHVDVVRVIHAHRDIPEWLRESGGA
jgi:toxin ParE1/3/4